MPLRPYQTEMAARLLAGLAAGRRPLGVLPTGGGKTQVAEEVLRRGGSRPVVFVHTTPLEQQTRRRIPFASCTTIQSALADGASGARLREQLGQADIAFVDEAHHIVSEEWGRVLTFLAPGCRVFGVTATPIRADKTPLADAFDELVTTANYSDLLAGGWLVPCDVWRSNIDRKTLKKSRQRPDGVQAYFEHGGLRPDGTPRPAIVFAPSIKECDAVVADFAARGVRAAVITAKTAATLRSHRFDAYSAGELDVLVSPMALAEGFDSPRAEVCVLLRSGDGIATFLQMVGRVLRPCPGKERALLIDCTGATELHGNPTDDRVYSLTGTAIMTLEQAAEAEAEAEEKERKRRERIEWERIDAEHKAAYNELLAIWRKHWAREANYGGPKGSALWAFRRETGMQLPRWFPSRYDGKCTHCKGKVREGEHIWWQPAPMPGSRSRVFHEVCFFEQLTRDELDAAQEARAQSTRVDRAPMRTEDIPFSWRAFDVGA